MTPKQKKALAILSHFIEEKGFAPTLSEYKGLLRLKSASTVHRVLRDLEALGCIVVIPHTMRGIRIVEGDPKNLLIAKLETTNAELRQKLSAMAVAAECACPHGNNGMIHFGDKCFNPAHFSVARIPGVKDPTRQPLKLNNIREMNNE